MQSAYVLGLAILTMAVAPKLIDAVATSLDESLAAEVAAYLGGVSLNWLFAIVLWHYYWGLEDRQNAIGAQLASVLQPATATRERPSGSPPRANDRKPKTDVPPV